jgi:hypothetical protein
MKNETKEFNLEDFYGTVLCQNWHKVTDGNQVVGYTGRITIIHASQIAKGVEFTGKDANWIARIEGGRSSMNVPGCQVHAIHEHPADLPVHHDCYKVP